LTIHLRKLCVGAEGIDDLARYIDKRVAHRKKAGLSHTHAHETRMWPKREDELLDGGSLYWIIKGMMCVRQPIAGFEECFSGEGIRYCRILLKPDLIRVDPRPHRPFQGWRYLKPDDSPRDLSASEQKMEPELARDLAELGLM